MLPRQLPAHPPAQKGECVGERLPTTRWPCG